MKDSTVSPQKTGICSSGGRGGNTTSDQDGYTLIEVIITIFIMGMILLVINVVLIALIRTSYDTDARLETRQGIEFVFEVIRRDLKSANPATIEVSDSDTLRLNLAESGQNITFSREVVDGVDGKGWIRADWGNGDYTNLTSVEYINIKSFDVVVNRNDISGTVEIVVTVEADSAHVKNSGDPVVKDFYKQTTIITRGQEI